MKIVFTLIPFILFVVTSVTAQQTVESSSVIELRGSHSYYFKIGNQLREDIQPGNAETGSLEFFITDSIQFHKAHAYSHKEAPHACQNRFYKRGFIDMEGKTIIPFNFDWIQSGYDTFLLAGRGNCMGLIDHSGKVIIPFAASTFYFHDNDYAVLKHAGDSSIICYSTSGKLLFAVNGYGATKLEAPYISIAEKNGRFKGIVNMQGEWIVSPGIYDYVRWIRGDFICASKDNTCGVINIKGKTIIPFDYYSISFTDIDQFIVYRNRLCGVVDVKNKTIIPLDSITVRNFGSLYAVTYSSSSYSALINYKGKKILPPEYNIYMPDGHTKAEANKTNAVKAIIVSHLLTKLQGLYRTDGVQILPVKYNYINYKPGFPAIIIQNWDSAVPRHAIYAAVDINGKMIIPFAKAQLMHIDYSRNILQAVNDNRKAAYINAKSGIAFTGYDYDYGFINDREKLPGGYFGARKNWRFALISPEGKQLTDAIYDGLGEATNKIKAMFTEAIVCTGRRNEKWYGITKEGREIPPISK